MSEPILTDAADGVAVVTLNRPEKLNAFAADMRERLRDALEAIAARGDVRVLVITGAGRAFCAGGDVKHMVALKTAGAPFDAVRPLLDAGRDVVTRVAGLPFPTIAAVNGPAAGAGMNLALACDLRVASDQATFGETFARIGLHLDWGGTYFLPRRVGEARAKELCWLGEPVDATEALRIGLANHVWPHVEFETRWRALARRIADAPAESVRHARANLTASAHRTLAECLDAEALAQEACWNSADSTEGLRAFVEKRPARFGGGDGSRGPAAAGGPVEAISGGAGRFE